MICRSGPQFLVEIVPDRRRQEENVKRERKIHQGSYLGIVRDPAPGMLIEQTIGFLFAAARMLIGMGLMKVGVFGGDRSTRFYILMMLLCCRCASAFGRRPTVNRMFEMPTWSAFPKETRPGDAC